MPFVSLGLSPSICLPLARFGYVTPTPVQTESIPVVLRGRDLLAKAQTGTGKTAAFGLPMIDRLLVRGGVASAPRKPRALVLVPTRELAVQVHAALATFAVPANLRVTAIFGGVSIGRQIGDLRRGTDIVVATPGRLIDHMTQRTIDLSAVQILTLDEADRMLDMGFLPPLRRILAALPRDRQTLFFSATISPEVVRLSADFTRDPARVDVSKGQVMATTVSHRVYPVSDQRKRDLLTHVLSEAPVGQALVFCKTRHGSARLAKHLERAGMRAAVINGDKSQGARMRALGDFKAGRVNVLVATDVAARGLDIVELPLVVNYELPLVAEDYIHRAGRTGRAGLAGRAVSFVSAGDGDRLRDIQRLVPAPFEQVRLEGFFQEITSARETIPDAGRRHHGNRHGHGGGGGGQRPGARRGPRGAGPRPSRFARPDGRGQSR